MSTVFADTLNSSPKRKLTFSAGRFAPVSLTVSHFVAKISFRDRIPKGNSPIR